MKSAFKGRMQVFEEGVRLVGAEVGFNPPDGHVDFCHFPGIRIAFLPVNSDAVFPPAVRLKEFDALHEHASGAAARVVNPAVVKGFQDGDDGFDDASGGIVICRLSRLHRRRTERCSIHRSCLAGLSTSASPMSHIGEDVHDVAQHPFVHIRAGVVLEGHFSGSCWFRWQAWFSSMTLLDFFQVRCRGHGGPARFFRDKEDVFR